MFLLFVCSCVFVLKDVEVCHAAEEVCNNSSNKEQHTLQSRMYQLPEYNPPHQDFKRLWFDWSIRSVLFEGNSAFINHLQ